MPISQLENKKLILSETKVYDLIHTHQAFILSSDPDETCQKIQSTTSTYETSSFFYFREPMMQLENWWFYDSWTDIPIV